MAASIESGRVTRVSYLPGHLDEFVAESDDEVFKDVQAALDAAVGREIDPEAVGWIGTLEAGSG